MTHNEIKNLFLNAYQNCIKLRPRLESCTLKIQDYEYKIYSYAALPILKKIIQSASKNYFSDSQRTDQQLRHTVRYIVDINGIIWFAPEGAKSKHTPTHAQMTDICIAAGNIVFDDNYQEIIKINNKSGHFLPGIETLIWPIVALLSLNATFAEKIQLEFQQGELFENEVYEFSPTELKKLIPDTALLDAQSDPIIRTITRNDITTKFYSSNNENNENTDTVNLSPNAKRRRIDENASISFFNQNPNAQTNRFETPPPEIQVNLNPNIKTSGML